MTWLWIVAPVVLVVGAGVLARTVGRVVVSLEDVRNALVEVEQTADATAAVRSRLDLLRRSLADHEPE